MGGLLLLTRDDGLSPESDVKNFLLLELGVHSV